MKHAAALPDHPLVALRRRRGWTRSDLASLCNLAYTSVSAVELGHRPLSFRLLHALRRLGIDADALERECADWTARRNAALVAGIGPVSTTTAPAAQGQA